MDTIFNTDGCFYRALDDEPIFVLLARDPCFAETIRAWETSRQALIGRGEKPQGDHPMLLEALATATAGAAWRNDATDPTNGYDAGQHARWHVEHVPERELVEVKRARGKVPSGGYMIPYDDWLTVLQTAMRLGNRFLLWEFDRTLVFNENRNWMDPDGEPDWTGYYPVNNSLQRDMLHAALRDHKAARQHKVDAIRGLVEVPSYANILRRANELGTEGRADHLLDKYLTTFSDDMPVTFYAGDIRKAMESVRRYHEVGRKATVTATSGAGEIDPDKEALWIDMAEERGFLSAADAEAARAALPEGTKAAITSKHRVFIVQDLAKKIATGLRQVTTDMTEWVESKNPKFLTTGSGQKMMAFVDRINGYAAELEAGEADAARFRSRPIRMHPALGAPYEPQEGPLGNPYKRFASLIDYQEMTVEDSRKIVEDFRKRFPDVLRAYEGLPTMAELVAKGVVDDLAGQLGKSYEEVSADYLRAAGVTKDAPLTARINVKAESDTLDVTDTPEMPPHRFAMFTKARGWAYGRGLEINPAHIPDMLDRMETDGWHLQAVFGGVEPTKVGMLFKRPFEQHADFRKPWEWIGSWCGKGLWVAGGLAPHRLQQLRDRISEGERLYQDEEPHRQPPMPPSVAEMMAAPTEGIDDADTDHGADDSWMGRGQEP